MTVRWVVAVASLAVAACQIATDFKLDPVPETSEELCVDERDGDFDGLTDCQDWNCLGVAACCDIPEVLIEDSFSGGPDSCDDAACSDASCLETACGADAERWHAWACPFATVCGGALWIGKTECYAGGVLSRSTAALGPGLTVTVDLIGQPERLGFLEAALTLQDEDAFPGSLDQCGAIQEVDGFAAARAVWSEDGVELVALFRGAEIGRTPAVAPGSIDDPRRLVIAVDRDRRITYALDGAVFATADVPVPTTDTEVRVALTGLTEDAAVSRVRVEAGIRCHAPDTWTPLGGDLEAAVVLTGDYETPQVFEQDEVYHPTLRDTGSGLELFYTACDWTTDVSCDAFQVGFGRAVRQGNEIGPFERDDDNPWVVPADLTDAGVLLNSADPELSICVTPDGERAGFGPLTDGASLVRLDEEMSPTGQAIGPAATGAWDAGEICCPTVLDGPDGVRRIWYAAHARDEDTYAIGLVTADDGSAFERVGPAPVLERGAPAAFDGGGVTNPTVIYDESRGFYRMWYEGHDFFGEVAIGYAVSTDGVRWSRYPGNPVLTAEDLGLVTVGGPAVRRASDGRLVMLVHGTTLTEARRRIFAIVNEGELLTIDEGDDEGQ